MPGAVGQAPALGIAAQHEAFVTGEPHGRPVGKGEHLRSHPSSLDRGLGAPNHCGKRAEAGAVMQGCSRHRFDTQMQELALSCPQQPPRRPYQSLVVLISSRRQDLRTGAARSFSRSGFGAPGPGQVTGRGLSPSIAPRSCSSLVPCSRNDSPLHSGAGPLHARFTPSSEVQ